MFVNVATWLFNFIYFVSHTPGPGLVPRVHALQVTFVFYSSQDFSYLLYILSDPVIAGQSEESTICWLKNCYVPPPPPPPPPPVSHGKSSIFVFLL